MNRIKTLRERLQWTQYEFAEYLGLRQSAVVRLEAGQDLRGPSGRLVDALESAFERGVVAPGATPEECVAAISLSKPASSPNPKAAK